MLEPVILDNTERLLAQSPYFAGMPRHTVIHADTLSGASSYFSAMYPVTYNPTLNIFHAASHGASSLATLRIVPDNFDTGGVVAVIEQSAYIQQMANEPGNTGRMWGFRRDSAGQDGLWMRTNLVAGTWSKIVGATNNDTQSIVKKTNGDLWYNNATAGNWYQLQNGAAGSVQPTVPTNLTTNRGYDPNVNAGGNYWSTPDSIAINQAFGGTPGSPLLYGTSSGYSHINSLAAVGFGGGPSDGLDPMVLWDNNWPSSPTFAANAICRLPNELLMYSKGTQQVGAGTLITNLMQLNDTYTLAVATYALGANDAAFNYPGQTTSRFPVNDGAPYKSFTRASLALINRATKVVKFIGFFNIPFHSENILAYNAAEIIPAAGQMLASARMINGELDLLTVGYIGECNGSVASYGAILTQIPLLKLDF